MAAKKDDPKPHDQTRTDDRGRVLLDRPLTPAEAQAQDAEHRRLAAQEAAKRFAK